jgi:hypothetical protein
MIFPPVLPRRGWIAFVLLAALGVAAGPPADGVVELPKFVVTDSRELPPPESWRYAAAPGLEILSKANERHMRQFARNFHRLRQVTEIVWPAILRDAPPAPALLILCSGGSEFDTFRPASAKADAGAPTSLLLHEQERTAIIVDVVREKPDDRLGALDLALEPIATEDEPVPGAAFLRENDPYREFYVQYFRLAIRRGTGHAPPWLEEGLVQLLASTEFSQDYVSIGRLRDGAGGQRADEFNVQLARRPLLPMGEMFARETPAPGTGGSYSPQCYAFVHLCLYGRKGRFRPALLKLVQRAAVEPVSAPVFQECFGLTFDQMGAELRTYVSFTAHEYVEYRLGGAGLSEAPPLIVREATAAEVGRIKGEAYQLAGQDERARGALLAPYLRHEHDPALLAALGRYEHRRGEVARARPLLEAAVRARVVDPRAYLELARQRWSEARAQLHPPALLSRAQAISILQPLATAARQPPPLPEVYELMAEVWAVSERAPSPEELALLYEGAQRFPRRPRLVYLTAALALRHGTAEHARALIDHGLKLTRDTEVHVYFQALQARLSPK